MSEEYPTYNGECKIVRHDPYYTPNNYDIYFNPNAISSNIPFEGAVSLQKRLQKLMPLSKYIHLNLDSEELNQTNHLIITSKMRINNKRVDFI